MPNLVATELIEKYPALPVFEQTDDRTKLGAAWMIEKCGWKGFRDGDAGVSAQHALVIVNHGNATGAELWVLANSVRESVFMQFGVLLDVEPQVVGPI